MYLHEWLWGYESLPWAFKAFSDEFTERPELVEWLGETLTEAFKKLQAIFGRGVMDKDKVIDFSKLKTPSPDYTLTYTIGQSASGGA
jgi:hypothetical protein